MDWPHRSHSLPRVRSLHIVEPTVIYSSSGQLARVATRQSAIVDKGRIGRAQEVNVYGYDEVRRASDMVCDALYITFFVVALEEDCDAIQIFQLFHQSCLNDTPDEHFRIPVEG